MDVKTASKVLELLRDPNLAREFYRQAWSSGDGVVSEKAVREAAQPPSQSPPNLSKDNNR